MICAALCVIGADEGLVRSRDLKGTNPSWSTQANRAGLTRKPLFEAQSEERADVDIGAALRT
ncbi:MAG: hypothetical protein ABI809_03260 [Caldimonas sp.]